MIKTEEKIFNIRGSISHPLLLGPVKQLKQDLGKYIDKLGEHQEYGEGDYA